MQKSNTIFLHIYRPTFLALSCLIFIIIFFCVSLATYEYINHKIETVDAGLEHLITLSKITEFQGKMIQKTLTGSLTNYNPDKNKGDLEKTMRALLRPSHTIYGIGYMENPSFGHYRIYLYHEPNSSQINSISLTKIYQEKHTSYYKRPWFVDVTKYKKSVVYKPQINWFGESQQFTMTYAYPFFNQQHQVFAVGVLDVDVGQFFTYFSHFSDLHKPFDVYLQVTPYPGAKTKAGFYGFNSKGKLKYAYPHKFAKNISDSWTIKRFSLYKRVSFINGGLNFLIKINFKPFIIALLFALFVLILAASFAILQVRKILKRKVYRLTSPIEIISNYLSHMIENKDFKQNLDSTQARSAEVQKLYSSVDQLRNDLLHYLEVEEQLHKKQNELNLAKKIQHNFISKEFDFHQGIDNGFDIATYFESASDLSGDVFDIVFEKNYLYIFIGDTSGKEAAASIFSLFVLSRFRMLAANRSAPKEILEHLNNYLFSFNDDNMFISAISIRVDLESSELLIANAGHDMPIILNKQRKHINTTEGDLVLGLFENISYKQVELNKSEIELMFLYTDGISEANDGKTQFGIKNILKLLRSVQKKDNATNILNSIMQSVNDFESTDASQDDKTAILIKHSKKKQGGNDVI